MPRPARRAGRPAGPPSSFAEVVVHTSVEHLRRHGVIVPADLTARLEGLIHPRSLQDLAPDADPASVIAARLATKGAPSDVEVVWIVLLEMFREHFREASAEMHAALRKQKMNAVMTSVFVDLSLGSKYFHLGRRDIAGDPDSVAGRFLLEKAIEVLTEVAQNGPRLSREQKQIYHSQIATASVILARRAEDDERTRRLLDQAEENSLLAERFGDSSSARYAYFAEIRLRRFAVDRDLSGLVEAKRMLDGLNSTGKRIAAARADVHAELAVAQRDSDNRPEVVRLLCTARDLYTAALDGPDDAEVHDGYLLAKRGRVHNVLYRTDIDHAGRRTARHLDAALSDLLDPSAEPHRHAPTVAAALLDRARIQVRRNDEEAARLDRGLARELLGPAASAGSPQLATSELDAAITAEAEAGDLDRIATLIEDVLETPAAQMFPSAAVARACKALLRSMDSPHHRDLVSRAVDRLELDLDHPDLTPAAERHIANQAALLAWQLARRDKDPYELDRILRLYRRSFSASTQSPSIDALGNVGTCALALAKQHLAGDEADAEAAGQLLIESTEWLEKSLTRAADYPGLARGDFDPVMAHSRCGEAALRAYPLVWDPTLLDTAAHHLDTAAELGQDAVELTGLRADARYRRGCLHGSIDDLDVAVELKDRAYLAGNRVRENRSVSAAAVLKRHALADEPRLLTDAAQRILAAAECDRRWPWAILQLAELAPSNRLLDHETLSLTEPTDLAAFLVAGDRESLRRRAAELAAHSTEFDATVIGGQVRTGEQGVRIINDPHRLLEHALVLKRLTADAAHSECDDTAAFRKWLTDNGGAASWCVPEPLGVIDVEGGDGVYVMTRLQGRVLGSAVVDRPERQEDETVVSRFAEALRFLAAYQRWRKVHSRAATRCGDIERRAFAAQLDKACRNLGASAKCRDLLGQMCAHLVEDGAPVVAKKDPHPGNWLWTRTGQLVMIDIEPGISLPLLQEAITIIDDLPLLPVGPAGDPRRFLLLTDYIAALEGDGLELIGEARTELEQRYEALVVLHALKGIGRLRAAADVLSGFTMRTQALQQAHYRAILANVERTTNRDIVRATIGQFRAHL